MKIVYMSDLHQEFNGPIKGRFPKGDVLLLGGDITIATSLREPTTTLKYQQIQTSFRGLLEKCKNFSRVYYILGNHEHYYSCFSETKIIIQKYIDNHFPNNNIKILDNDYEIYDEVLFIGSTLWTDFNNQNPQDMIDIQWGLNDYRLIVNKPWESISYVERNSPKEHHLITSEFILDEFRKSRNFIQKTLSEKKKIPTVVLTHHAPSWKSQHEKRFGSGLGGAFYSNMDWLIQDNPQIKYWFHGHSHDNVDYMLGGTRILSNQQGYPKENLDFVLNKWVKI